jgi:dynein heavy chain
MPKQEESLAMPPVEILRQLLDQGGWYDLKDPKHPFVKLVDTTVVAAMGPPGGGKSIITPRFQRWFNTVIFALVDEQTMKNIFQAILSYYFRENKFSNEIVAINEKLVSATLIVYKRIQEDLKPTPAKSHYTFNLRDVSKVICGICLMEKKELSQTDTAVRLWAHETSRVFGDRLINESDRKWILGAI